MASTWGVAVDTCLGAVVNAYITWDACTGILAGELQLMLGE